jgi:hypothetical protein
MLIGQNDGWLVCRRYLSEESMRLIFDAPNGAFDHSSNDDEQGDLAALAA